MTTAQKAAFAAELELWIDANPGYTTLSFASWIENKLRELYRVLLVASFVDFVWEGIKNGTGPLSSRCDTVADEFATTSVPAPIVPGDV